MLNHVQLQCLSELSIQVCGQSPPIDLNPRSSLSVLPVRLQVLLPDEGLSSGLFLLNAPTSTWAGTLRHQASTRLHWDPPQQQRGGAGSFCSQPVSLCLTNLDFGDKTFDPLPFSVTKCVSLMYLSPPPRLPKLSSSGYLVPEDFHQRNLELIQSIRMYLRDDETKFNQFKNFSAQFRQVSC